MSALSVGRGAMSIPRNLLHHYLRQTQPEDLTGVPSVLLHQKRSQGMYPTALADVPLSALCHAPDVPNRLIVALQQHPTKRTSSQQAKDTRTIIFFEETFVLPLVLIRN